MHFLLCYDGVGGGGGVILGFRTLYLLFCFIKISPPGDLYRKINDQRGKLFLEEQVSVVGAYGKELGGICG